MGIASGINHFVQSIFEVIQGIFAAILHAFQFVLQSFVDLGKGFVHFVEGTLGFAIRKFLTFIFVARSPLVILLLTHRGGLRNRQLLHSRDRGCRRLRLHAVHAAPGHRARLALRQEQVKDGKTTRPRREEGRHETSYPSFLLHTKRSGTHGRERQSRSNDNLARRQRYPCE